MIIQKIANALGIEFSPDKITVDTVPANDVSLPNH